MRNYPVTLISAVDTSSQTGSPVFVGQAYSASLTAIFKDVTATGTVQLYGSNEMPVGNPQTYVPSAGSFAVITGAATTAVAGVAPAIILANLPFQYIKAIYTRTGGGSSTILVNATILGI